MPMEMETKSSKASEAVLQPVPPSQVSFQNSSNSQIPIQQSMAPQPMQAAVQPA